MSVEDGCMSGDAGITASGERKAWAKIGFVLSSPARDPLPSTRISVLNMLPYLTEAGYEAEIVFEPEVRSERPDVGGVAARLLEKGVAIAYFQKVLGPDVIREVRILAKAGVKTVFGVCDVVDDEMAAATDATLVVTEFLKGLYAPELRHKIHVVHDGIENPEFSKPQVDAVDTQRRVSAVLVTSSQLEEIPVIGRPPGFLDVTVVGHYPRQPSRFLEAKALYWKLNELDGMDERMRLLRNRVSRRFRTCNWSADSVYRYMVAADIGIIPVDMKPDPIPGLPISSWQVKSENRLTLTMALGLPVVASPVPSYLDVIDQGRNGFIAETRRDWMRCLEALRDPELRSRMGAEARASVLVRYSKKEQARRLIGALGSL